MNTKCMTAMMSAFARAYHSEGDTVKVFDDSFARRFFLDGEFEEMKKSIIMGADFFSPPKGLTEDEKLRFAVNSQLAPSPLGRAAFSERALKTAAQIGAKQYLILAAGFDSFILRQPVWAENMGIFEIDREECAAEKRDRIAAANLTVPENVSFISADFCQGGWEKALLNCEKYDRNKTSFCSILGLSYYLSKEDFTKMLSAVVSVLGDNSSIVFDCLDENAFNERAGERAKKQSALARAAGEEMKQGWSYAETEKMLSDMGFLIYEYLIPKEITEQFFDNYNLNNPGAEMTAFDNVCYYLAVKKKRVRA